MKNTAETQHVRVGSNDSAIKQLQYQIYYGNQSITSMGLKSPQSISNQSMIQQTPQVRMRQNAIWDNHSNMDDATYCQEDSSALERTGSIDLRQQLDFVLSPDASRIVIKEQPESTKQANQGKKVMHQHYTRIKSGKKVIHQHSPNSSQDNKSYTNTTPDSSLVNKLYIDTTPGSSQVI